MSPTQMVIGKLWLILLATVMIERLETSRRDHRAESGRPRRRSQSRGGGQRQQPARPSPVDDYEMIELLRDMQRVRIYVVRHRQDGATYVLKMIGAGDSANEWEAAGRMIQARTNVHGLLRYYRRFQISERSGNTNCIVMEYALPLVDNAELYVSRARTEDYFGGSAQVSYNYVFWEKQLTSAAARTFVRDIAGAFAEMTRLGIWHEDLEGNIMLAQRPGARRGAPAHQAAKAVVFDFGMCRLSPPSTSRHFLQFPISDAVGQKLACLFYDIVHSDNVSHRRIEDICRRVNTRGAPTDDVLDFVARILPRPGRTNSSFQDILQHPFISDQAIAAAAIADYSAAAAGGASGYANDDGYDNNYGGYGNDFV